MLSAQPGAVIVLEVAAVDGREALERDELGQPVDGDDPEAIGQFLWEDRPNDLVRRGWGHSRVSALAVPATRKCRGYAPAQIKRKNHGALTTMMKPMRAVHRE